MIHVYKQLSIDCEINLYKEAKTMIEFSFWCVHMLCVYTRFIYYMASLSYASLVDLRTDPSKLGLKGLQGFEIGC